MYRRNRHSCYDLEYHLVVVTKYRHPVITGALKDRLLAITETLFTKNWNCRILEVNTDRDHIHILFEAPPQVQLSVLVNNYKTVTSRRLRKEFEAELKPYYGKPYFWSDSYFIGSVSDRSQEQIVRYIRDQGIRDTNPS